MSNVGYVYAVGVDGNCKIGFTKSPESRVNAVMNEAFPWILNCRVYVSCVSSFAKDVEQSVHHALSELLIDSAKYKRETFSICFDDAVSLITSSMPIETDEDRSAATQSIKKAAIMAPVRFTDEQMEWIDSEAKRVGSSKSAVVSSLVQEMIEGE